MGLFMFLIFGVSFSYYGVYGGRSISQGGLEGRKLVPDEIAVKTIPPSNSDEYDCVDIYKQPAFNHPLLKNHKIQMNPSFLTKRKIDEALTKTTLTTMDFPGASCPSGMVPMQKSKGEDEHVGSFRTLSSAHVGEYFATLDTTKNTTYYGARANISIWNPQVLVNQYSKAQIWVRNGPDDVANVIEIGWAVHPALYGNNGTRLTGHWTADGYQKTGCYNALCPGFVQVHPYYYLGIVIPNISVLGGVIILVDVSIIQDQSTGNWWVMVANDIKIGYWPKELFTHLASGASSVRYGGATFSPPNVHTRVPMGNGHFPSGEIDECGLFANVHIMNSDYQLVDITPDIVVKNHADGQCYEIIYPRRHQPSEFRQAFTYGGPGGRCR